MATAAVTMATDRPAREPRRLDMRALGGLLLMALGLASSFGYWVSNNDTRDLVIAAHDLPAGSVLGSGDVAIATVRVDDSIYRAAVPSSAVSGLVGKRLATPVYAGQVIAQRQVSGPEALGPGQVAMSIPIAAADAATGILPMSDVQVLMTSDKGKPDSKTTVVLARARVADVVYDQSQAVVKTGSGGTGSQQRVSSLTLVVTPDQAVQLAQARFNGDLSVTLLPPEGS